MKLDRVMLRDLIGAVVLLALVLPVAAFLGGCATTYRAERIDAEAGVTTNVSVRTYREFPGGVQIHYDRDAGKFDVEAGKVQNGNDAMAEVILGLLPLLKQGDLAE